MPRQARRRSESDCYHVIMRGNNKSFIFKDTSSKLYFLKTMQKVESEEAMDLVAWCIMDNHVHMVIKVCFNNFERVFKRLNVSYALYFHKKNNSVGHVFQGRVKSIPLESDESIINNIRYIHNNPVKAGMVDHAKSYRWSSYNIYLSGAGNQMISMVKEIIGKSKFETFHLIEDKRIYLEIKEEQEILKEECAQMAIEEVCKKYNINDSKEINNNEILGVLVNEVMDKSGFSGRKTANFLQLSEGTVRRLKNK